MAKNELSNTFLDGTVLTAKYKDGKYIVEANNESIGEYESFDEMVYGIAPFAKSIAEEIEEINTLAVGLMYSFDGHEYKHPNEVISMFLEDEDDDEDDSASYDSKEEYIESHLDDFYTWSYENNDCDDIDEDDLMEIVKSAIDEEIDFYTDDDNGKIYLQGYHDILDQDIRSNIENKIDEYYESH